MEDMDVDVVNKLRGSDIDAGPCRISLDRFKYLNTLKYHRDLTRQEMSDYLGYQFYKRLGYNLDLDNPVTYNEKLNWLKVNYHDPLMKQCVDKATFDEFVAGRLPDMSGHHVKKLAILHSPQELTEKLLTSLTEHFVMKSNFGSGAQIFVDRDLAKLSDLQGTIARYLNPRANHYYLSFEYGYKGLKPAVVIEPVIRLDYKLEFYCFQGEPFIYRVVQNAGTRTALSDLYTLQGEKIDARWPYENLEIPYQRPSFFNDVLQAAEVLGKGFPHVRVDFHVTRDSWYFNELTFYPWAGLMPFDPYKLDVLLGSRLDLDKIRTSSCA